jgi:hypothetical protein
MRRAALAGVLYAIALFALGFVLGTIRVLLVAPRLGQTVATLIELPVMLTAAFFVCRWVLRHWQLPPALSGRALMAVCFLALLLSLEVLLGVTLFGRTAGEQWTALGSPAGLTGLTAQIVTALFPLLIGRRGSSWPT